LPIATIFPYTTLFRSIPNISKGMEKRSETIDPDFELCVRLADGDHASFSEMYSKYNHKVYGFILKYIHSPELTKDLTQEVFIKIDRKSTRLNSSHVKI